MKVNRILVLGLLMAMLSMPNPSFAVSWTDGSVIHEYEIFQNSGIPWDGAASWINTTLGEDWYLATITDAAEQLFVETNILAGLGGEYWIGGYQNETDSPPKDNWHWVTGEPWIYTNWAFGEANDFYGKGSESYLGANWNGFYWNDEANLGNIAGFVAEKTSSVPEPSTMFALGSGLLGLWGFRRKFKK